MFKNERSGEILTILKREGYCTVKRLSQLLYTSESSIRRNLSALAEAGIIKRSYGGAELLISHSAVASFEARSHHNIAAKQKIAKKALSLIRPGNIVFLDQSSTALFLACELADLQNLTVVTNNLEILNVLMSSELTVYASGGLLTRGCTGFVGADAEATFRGIYADICFFSAKSLSDDGIISDCFKEEIALRNAMFGNAEKVIFLCDSSKFGSRSSFRQCALSDVDGVITECDRHPFLEKLSPKALPLHSPDLL